MGALLSFRVPPHGQKPFHEPLEIAMPVSRVYHGLGDVVPGFDPRVARHGPEFVFFARPWRFPGLPWMRTHRPIRRVFRTIESPGLHPKGKQKCVRIHMVSFRGGSSENQAWQRRPFPLTETAKSYNNRGGWAKSSTTIEVIEPLFEGEGYFFRLSLAYRWRNFFPFSKASFSHFGVSPLSSSASSFLSAFVSSSFAKRSGRCFLVKRRLCFLLHFSMAA